jgi:hypothetical protein
MPDGFSSAGVSPAVLAVKQEEQSRPLLYRDQRGAGATKTHLSQNSWKWKRATDAKVEFALDALRQKTK